MPGVSRWTEWSKILSKTEGKTQSTTEIDETRYAEA